MNPPILPHSSTTEGNVHSDGCPTWLVLPHLQPTSIHLPQPLIHVAQAVTRLLPIFLVHAWPMVCDGDLYLVPLRLDADGQVYAAVPEL